MRVWTVRAPLSPPLRPGLLLCLLWLVEPQHILAGRWRKSDFNDSASPDAYTSARFVSHCLPLIRYDNENLLVGRISESWVDTHSYQACYLGAAWQMLQAGLLRQHRLISHDPESWKSETQPGAGLVSPGASLPLAYKWPSSPWSSFSACLCPNPFLEGHWSDWMRAHPVTSL